MTTPDTLNPYEQIWQSRDLKALESTPIKLNNKRPEWKKGLNAFVDEMQGTGYGLAALASQGVENVVGPNDITKGITDWGLEGYNRNMEESQAGINAPKVARVEDVHTASDAMDWASFQLGKGLPMLASLAVPAAIGGTVARLGAKEGVAALAKSAVGDTVKKAVTTKAIQAAEGDIVNETMRQAAAKALRDRITAGAVTGGYLGSFGLEGGQSFGETVTQGAAPEDAVKSAIAVGGINGALEFLPFYSVAKSIGLGQYAKKGIMDIIKNDAGLSKKAVALATAKELGGRALKGGLVGAGAEGITEGLQELTSIAGLRWAKQDPLFADLTGDDWNRIGNAMAAGALVGGVAAGAGATLKGPEVTDNVPTNTNTTTSPAKTSTINPAVSDALRIMREKRIIAAIEAAHASGDTTTVDTLISSIKSRLDYLNEEKAKLGSSEIHDKATQNQEALLAQVQMLVQKPVLETPPNEQVQPVTEEQPIPGAAETQVQSPLEVPTGPEGTNGVRKEGAGTETGLALGEVAQPQSDKSIQLKRGEEIVLTPDGTPVRATPTPEEVEALRQRMGPRPGKQTVQPIEDTANAQEVQAQTETPVKGTSPLYSKSIGEIKSPNEGVATEASMEEFEAVRRQFQERQKQETPFKNWFGKGTKDITANADGTPITLYHGTNNPTFNQWDSSRAGKASAHPTSGLGFFMTADKGAAARYGNNLMALHAKIQNPYTLTDADLTSIETKEDATKLRKRLMAKGYDGAVVKAPGAKPYVIAFDSKQVKFVTNESPTDSPDFRYSFAGKNATTADLMSLANAEARIAKGDNKETVRQETGWHQGADGKWRFEISDNEVEWKIPFENIPETKLFDKKQPLPLTDVISHPELFASYPELAKISVIKQTGFLDFGGLQGWFNDDNLQIGITPYAENPLSTLLHEIQHVIQMYEGFAKGGNENSVWDTLPNETKEQIAKDILEKLGKQYSKASKDLNIFIELTSGDNSNKNLLQDYIKLYTTSQKKWNEYSAYMESNPDDKKTIKSLSDEWYKEWYKLSTAADNVIKEISSSLDLSRFNVKSVVDHIAKIYDTANNVKDELRTYEQVLAQKANDVLVKMSKVKQGDEDTIKKEANLYDFYLRLAGETEARLTQARQGMTAEERKQKSPESMQEYPNEKQIVVTQGASAASQQVPITRSVTPEEFRSNIDSIMGEGWLQQAEAAGIIQVVDAKGSRGEAGSWDGNTFKIYLQSMPVNGSPAGVLLHEGSHAPTFKQILGDSIEGFLSDLDKLAANGNKAAQKAIMHATIASANVLGIKHNLDKGGSKEDFANVQALIEEQKPGLLAEEKLAYFIQYGSETQSGAGFLKRLINAIKAWFAQTQLGQVLKAAGIGFELNEGMAVEWAKMSLQRSLDNAQQAAKVREQVVNEAKLMPPSVRLGRALAALDGNYSFADEAVVQNIPETSLDAVRAQYENTDKWMKAPNGKDTNLNERQWLQVRTPEFKAWFGDWEGDPANASKVVDDNGEPKVMYHGTNKNQDGDAFTMFDTYSSNYGLMGLGGYFTDNPDIASSYTKKGRGDTPTVYPVFLSIKNPVDMNVEGSRAAWEKAFPDIDFNEYKPNGTTNESYFRAIEEYVRDLEVPKYEGNEIVQDVLLNMKADGITHIGGTYTSKSGVTHQVYIAFHPEQIKSATGNTGEFSSTNPDIRYSYAGSRALTADKVSLQQAVRRIANNEDPETVRKETGWFKGKDGKWRFEIDDSELSFNTDWIINNRIERHKLSAEMAAELPDEIDWEADTQWAIGEKDTKILDEGDFIDKFETTVGELINHPKLFEAYPQLRDIGINFIINTMASYEPQGSYSPSNNEIEIKAYTYENAKKLLIHELQHAVQAIEGFAAGGAFNDPNYIKLAGEIEARDTARRIDMTSEQRQAKQPYVDTMFKGGIADKDVIINPTNNSDTYYSMGIQELKDTLWTDPTDSRVDMVNKPGLLQRWRADFIDFFAEIEKKSKTVYDAFTLLRNKKAARLAQARQEYYLPLLKEIVGSKWTAKQVGDMAAARHHKVDKVNTRLAERASYGYTKELLKALPKTKRQELMEGRVNIKAGKMPDGKPYLVNGVPATMSSVTKQKLMFDLMNKYSQFEITDANGKQALREEWEIFKDAAGGFSDGGVAKGMVRTVDEVLAPASSDQARFDRIAALFDAMNRHALQIREDGGLITAAEHARLLIDKSAYAPLKRESYNVNTETMRLFQQAGRGGSKNLGTRAGTAELSEPTNVLQNALALLEASAAAAERNLANQELYKVVNANKAAWKPWFHIAVKDEYVTHDEDGFLQEKNSTAVNRADIVLIKDGKKIVIRPNMHNERAMGFVRAANNLDAQDLSGPMKVLGMFNNIVRAVNITFSPVFLMMNAIKDPLTAAYNLQATEGAKHTKEIFVKDYFKTYRDSFRMLKKVFMDNNRDRTDADVKWVERYENAGGRTSFIEQLKENDNTWRSFDAQVARRQGNFKHLMAVKDTWIDGIENLNILFENVMRFSTFRVLVQKGMSDTDAARIAQDLTTNFSRRGYKSQALGLWWLFFNASVQGNYQVVRNLMKSKRLQVLSLGTIAFAVMLDLLGRAIADDWDEIPEWDKERFIIIPVKVGGDYVKIPAPWVYNTLWRTGGLIGEMFSGVKEPQDALLDMAAMTATTFNPLGKPGSIAQAIAPTAADPFIQILENKDFAGNPIGPEGYPGASKKANSELLWSSTPKGYQSIARFVNEVTGGSATESGGIDLKPGDYQLLAKFLTGSIGRFLTDSTFGFAEDVKKGIEGPKDIPVIREFFSDPYDPLTVQKYHTNIASIYGAHRLERMYREGPDRDLIKLQEVRSERGEELRMYSQAQDVERQLKSLRVRLKAAQARDDVGREKQLKERMAQVQEQFNAAYRQRVN